MKASQNLATTAAAQPLVIPTAAEVSPAYVAAKAREADLRADLQAAEGRREALMAEVARLANPNGADGTTTELALRAAALINSGNMPSSRSTRDRFLQVNTEIETIREALRLIAMTIVSEQQQAAILICRGLKPVHDILQADLIAAAQEFYGAMKKLFEFTDELERRGIARSSLKTALPWFAGHYRDKQSGLANFFKDAKESGFISRDDIPESLRFGR